MLCFTQIIITIKLHLTRNVSRHYIFNKQAFPVFCFRCLKWFLIAIQHLTYHLSPGVLCQHQCFQQPWRRSLSWGWVCLGRHPPPSQCLNDCLCVCGRMRSPWPVALLRTPHSSSASTSPVLVILRCAHFIFGILLIYFLM